MRKYESKLTEDMYWKPKSPNAVSWTVTFLFLTLIFGFDSIWNMVLQLDIDVLDSIDNHIRQWIGYFFGFMMVYFSYAKHKDDIDCARNSELVLYEGEYVRIKSKDICLDEHVMPKE